MPIGEFEREILRRIAGNRNPDSFIGGATVLHQSATSEVELGREQETFRRAIVRRAGHGTKLEWVFDSAFRFFPIEPDAELGWRLNFWDAATNKALALFGRREFRTLWTFITSTTTIFISAHWCGQPQARMGGSPHK